ncbi:MAG: GDSL-type esterase/lipase family protein [Magnetospirillum sp.]
MPPSRLCFIGDSFVQGCGDPEALGWVGRVCADRLALGHDLTAYNLGIRGQTSGQIACRWYAESLPRLSAHPFEQRGLVFSFGANDAAQMIAPDQTHAHTQSILDQARLLAPVLMVGPAPIADSPASDAPLQHLCQMMAQCAKERQIAYLPIFSDLRHNQSWMAEAVSGDGAHPAAGGYAALAELVRRWDAWRDWFR